jgi:hypothetical protein
MNVAGHGDRAPFIRGIDDPVERLGRLGPASAATGRRPTSSITIRSARRIRATVLAIDPSIFVRARVLFRVSRVNQATRRSFSIAA